MATTCSFEPMLFFQLTAVHACFLPCGFSLIDLSGNDALSGDHITRSLAIVGRLFTGDRRSRIMVYGGVIPANPSKTTIVTLKFPGALCPRTPLRTFSNHSPMRQWQMDFGLAAEEVFESPVPSPHHLPLTVSPEHCSFEFLPIITGPGGDYSFRPPKAAAVDRPKVSHSRRTYAQL